MRDLDSGDGRRPVTVAVNDFRNQREYLPIFASVDVVGLNYAPPKVWDRLRERLPTTLVVSLESYPADAARYWAAVEARPFVLGDFTWTAADYIGEASIGASGLFPPDPRACERGYCVQGWPYYAASCGDLDLVGRVRPQARAKRVLWGQSSLELAVRPPAPASATGAEVVALWGWPDERASWTWPGHEGRPLLVRLYGGAQLDAIAVEVLPSGGGGGGVGAGGGGGGSGGVGGGGRSVERAARLITATVDPHSLAAETWLPYWPGTLRAVGIVAGRAVANRSLVTVGPARSLALRPERTRLRPRRSELVFVEVTVRDAEGRRLPDTPGVHVAFEVLGGALELAAVGSGDPWDASSFRAAERRTFRGSCTAILRVRADLDALDTGGRHAAVVLRATSRGLAPANTTLVVRGASRPA